MSEDIFEAREVTQEVTLRVLSEAEEALEREGIPHMLMGGLASSAHGRPRGSTRESRKGSWLT